MEETASGSVKIDSGLFSESPIVKSFGVLFVCLFSSSIKFSSEQPGEFSCKNSLPSSSQNVLITVLPSVPTCEV